MPAKRNKKGAAAILGLLVVVAIMMMLYFVDIKTIFNPSGVSVKSSAPEKLPWLEEDRILPENTIIKLPSPPKPKIEDDFTITAPVNLDGKDRGSVKIRFNSDGTTGGIWTCEYSHDTQIYSYNAEFAGNIDISRPCTTDGDEDNKKLFLINKGQYKKSINNTTAGRIDSEIGTIYVTGCLSPDYSLSGNIVITTDKKWSAVYSFTGIR